MKENIPISYCGKLSASNDSHLQWLFNKYWNSFVLGSMKITLNQVASEEIVSDKFILIYKGRYEFKCPVEAGRVLWKMIKNASFDFVNLNKTATKKKNQLSLIIQSDYTIPDKEFERIKTDFFDFGIWQKVKELVSPRQYDIIRSRFFEGLSPDEVATKYKLTYKGIKSRTQEAMIYLRKSVELRKALMKMYE